MKRMLQTALMLTTLLLPLLLQAADYKPIVPAEGYAHDRWGTDPRNIVRQFRAYVVSFDNEDDNDGDGTGENWGLPEWVAYEIRKHEGDLPKGPKRPGRWLTDKELYREGIAPNDSTYRNSGYDRGHMCMKQIGWRLGANADWNTHTVLNACPQLRKFNAGIWLDMEYRTQNWADLYGEVWVICGPVLKDRKPARFIGDPGEMKIPIPDGFFKIVVKHAEGTEEPDVLGLLYPHKEIEKDEKGAYDHRKFVVKVDEIEAVTGIDFLSALPDETEEKLEDEVDTDDWDWSKTVRGSTRREAPKSRRVRGRLEIPRHDQRRRILDHDPGRHPRRARHSHP